MIIKDMGHAIYKVRKQVYLYVLPARNDGLLSTRNNGVKVLRSKTDRTYLQCYHVPLPDTIYNVIEGSCWAWQFRASFWKLVSAAGATMLRICPRVVKLQFRDCGLQ